MKHAIGEHRALYTNVWFMLAISMVVHSLGDREHETYIGVKPESSTACRGKDDGTQEQGTASNTAAQ